MTEPNDTKECNTCGLVKPLIDFGTYPRNLANNKVAIYIQSNCKKCDSERQKARYQAKKDEINEKQKEYYQRKKAGEDTSRPLQSHADRQAKKLRGKGNATTKIPRFDWQNFCAADCIRL